MSCTCGTSTVSSWTGASVVALNGHDNLIQELHLWKRQQKTSQKTVLLIHTGHDVEHQVPEDNEGRQHEVHCDQEDQPRGLTHKLVFTVEPSKR